MRIMIDANVIYSALTLPISLVGKRLQHIKENHTLVLCEYVIKESEGIFEEKRPKDLKRFKLLLNNMADEIFDLKEINETKYPHIRDIKDYPVLASAIEADVDLLITGDTDFDDVKYIKKPRIITPGEYEKMFM